MIRVDYITASSRGKEISLVEVPCGGVDDDIQWQAGRARYYGYSITYKNGYLQLMYSEEQGSLVRASGAIADEFAASLPSCFRLSRLDLCIDVPVEIDLLSLYRRQKSESGKIHCTLINNQTLYVGSRKSERFWRVYDKAAEQGLVGPLYRIEVELKGNRARQAQPCLADRGLRMKFFRGNAIGVVEDIIDVFVGGASEYDLQLPRRRPNSRFFYKNVVLPFLLRNPSFLEELRKELSAREQSGGEVHN